MSTDLSPPGGLTGGEGRNDAPLSSVPQNSRHKFQLIFDKILASSCRYLKQEN